MEETIFEKLSEGLDFLCEFFQYWLTEEEAKFLIFVPSLPTSIDAIAEKAGVTAEEAREMLQTLIEKTMAEDFEAEGLDERLYARASLIAWTENYLHRYVDLDNPNPREIDVKLGQWFEAIKKSDYNEEREPKMGRIIPMEKAISDTRGVIPTSEASKIVEEASYISVMRCPCRSTGHLAGTVCEHPMEVCFSMNDYARYQVEYGFAREVTKEWAKKTLRECEERGLAHVTDNIRGNYNMLCNCCPCHCIGLVGFTKADQVPRMAKTAFLSSVTLGKCKGAGLCIGECQYGALSMEDAKAKVDEDRCIGCGVCVGVCPSKALSLKARSAEKAEKYYESKEKYFAEMPPEKIDGDIENAKYIH
jgi:ferredoxin/predicted RNase H-like HicB family nuclease